MKMRLMWLAGLSILVTCGVSHATESWQGSFGKTKSESESRDSKVKKLYQKGLDAIETEDHQEAVRIFRQAYRENRTNPDVLNMLAYSMKKTGEIDEAIEYYHKALKIKPQFPEAREYLGEAYLQALMREIDTLQGYGGDGEIALEKLLEAVHEATGNLERKTGEK